MIGQHGAVETTEIKEFLSSLIGNAPIGIVALDIDGNCILANGRAASVFDTEPMLMVDVSLDDILDAWPELNSQQPMSQTSGRINFNLTAVPRNHQLYNVSGRSIVNGMLLTFHDVTEDVLIRKAQDTLVQRLERANRELAEFAYICAHDMKSPVSNLIGLFEHIDECEGIEGEAAELIDMVRHTSHGLHAKIRSLNDILAFKKTLGDSGGSSCLADSIDNAVQSLQQEIASTSTEISVDSQEGATLPISDPHLQSVLHNLLSNAVKYRHAERNPQIRIHAATLGDTVVLEISDNGLGMDLERIGDKLFGLFSRAHTHVEGTGIGLYLVKSIVESYGGEIKVESVENCGTTFRLELPHAA